MSVRLLTSSVSGQVRDSVNAIRQVLASPRVRFVAATSLMARLPKGMVPLALVLMMHQATTSYATGGLAAALFSAGDALSAAAQGRLADRFGRGWVLIPSAVVHMAGLGGVLILVRLGVPVGATAVAFLAGVGMPPISGSIKAAWPKMAGRDAVAAAYAVESLLQQVVFFTGPLAVAAITAAGSPALALACSGCLTAAGTVGFVAAAAAVAPVRKTLRGQRPRGAWHVPAVRILTCATLAQSTVFGALPVGIAAETSAARLPDLAGVILAALTAGGLIGTFGPSVAPGRRNYLRLSCGFAVALLSAATFSAWPSAALLIATGGALALAGLFVTPLAATTYVLTQRATAAGQRTEAFTWLSTGQAIGNAVGASLAGIAASAGPAAALALLPLAAGLSAIIARTVPMESPESGELGGNKNLTPK